MSKFVFNAFVRIESALVRRHFYPSKYFFFGVFGRETVLFRSTYVIIRVKYKIIFIFMSTGYACRE